MKKDIEHLNLLAIFHYVMAGLTGLTALLPLLYVGIGVMILVSAPNAPKGGGPPPAIIGWIFVIVFGGLSLLMVVMAVVCGMAGYGLHKHKWRMFCFINAAILL